MADLCCCVAIDDAPRVDVFVGLFIQFVSVCLKQRRCEPYGEAASRIAILFPLFVVIPVSIETEKIEFERR
jgi:hypothetical protein